MSIIYKYEISIADNQTISVPTLTLRGQTVEFRDQILKVDTQYNKPVIWAMIDEKAEKVERNVYVRGTGQDCDNLPFYDYVGTFQQYDGQFIGHVFVD